MASVRHLTGPFMISKSKLTETRCNVTYNVRVSRSEYTDLKGSCFRHYPAIYLDCPRKRAKNLSQIWYPSRDSNLSPPTHKSRTLQLQRTARSETWCVTKFEIVTGKNVHLTFGGCKLILRTYLQVTGGHKRKPVEFQKSLNFYQLFSLNLLAHYTYTKEHNVTSSSKCGRRFQEAEAEN